jgi:transcriptional regulator with XRE-family HTH domain
MNQVNLADLAQRLIWLRKRRGLTQEELAKGCRAVRTRLFSAEWLPRVPHIRRDRIAKIELAASSSANGARSIWDNEIRLLAAALDVPETWLRGSTNGCDAVWDCNIEPARARAIADLIAFHEENASERWTWTRVLPCSLQSPEFLRRYAKIWASSITRETAGYQHRERVAESLLLIGEANRQRTLQLLAAKKLQWFVALPTDTIKSIARGSDTYSGISPSLRLHCLRGLVQLLEGFQETLHLVLVGQATITGKPPWFASYEGVYVSGGLAAWTDFNGIRYLSEEPTLVQTMRERVQATFARARYKRREEVLAFVRHEIDALATALARRRTKPGIRVVARSA